MAPRGNKRTTAAAASPKKKSRVDPKFAGIVATLSQVNDSLSENCREMLVAMASPCLTTFKSDRHDLQKAGVEMIEETLLQHKNKLIEAKDSAQAKLTELEGSKAALVQALDEAKVSLEAKKTCFLSAHNVREEAKTAVKAAESALADAKKAQAEGDAKFDSLEKEKVALEAAHSEHFKAPMEASEGPHHQFLKPFIATLGLEDSLTSALPSSCEKAKEQRGGFDDLVLAELGKALERKISILAASIVEEESGVSGRKDAIAAAEAGLEAKLAAERSALTEMESAASAQHEAEGTLKKASDEWATFEPRVQAATDERNMHDAIRLDFEEGALKDFMSLRDKEAPAPIEAEAAPAGA